MAYQEPSAALDRLAHDTIGAAIEVHRQLGPGFLERTYEDALAIELRLRGIPFELQCPINLFYKGHPIGKGVMDLRIDEQLVVGLKAVDRLAPIHEAQVISYLKATTFMLGLLINFNVIVLKRGIRRVVLSE